MSESNQTMDFMERLQAEDQIRHALGRYFRGADRMDYELLASAYHEGAHDDHGGQKGEILSVVDGFRKRHATIEQNLHLAGTSIIEFAGGKAYVETPCLLVQHARMGDAVNFTTKKPVYRRFVFGCRYIDRFEKRANEWRIQHRTVAFEWTEEQLTDWTLGSDWVVARRSREDAVYRVRESE